MEFYKFGILKIIHFQIILFEGRIQIILSENIYLTAIIVWFPY